MLLRRNCHPLGHHEQRHAVKFASLRITHTCVNGGSRKARVYFTSTFAEPHINLPFLIPDLVCTYIIYCERHSYVHVIPR